MNPLDEKGATLRHKPLGKNRRPVAAEATRRISSSRRDFHLPSAAAIGFMVAMRVQFWGGRHLLRSIRPGVLKKVCRLGLLAFCLMKVGRAWAATEADAGWPRSMTTTNGNRVEIFQPQLESWKGNRLQARAVVEITLAGDANASLGVAWFNADTRVNQTNRLVTLDNVTVGRVQFSSMAEQEANMLAVTRAALPLVARTIALDRLSLASVMAQSQSLRKSVSLRHDPPLVIWTTNAVAALVLIDGDPVLRPVRDSSLLRVINTSALILFDPSGGTYYLAGNGGWFRSEGITGPWGVVANPPASVGSLTPPSDQPARTSTDPGAGSPVVFVSTKPAELLQTKGAPQYKYEEGSGLMYLANTDSQVLYNPLGGTVYLQLSGRWFSSPGSLTGPWTYLAPKDLPSTFSQIMPQGIKGFLLSSVPGTPQAAAARVANSLPQTATIQRRGSSFEVQYDGPPQFKAIEGTSLQYAVNASEPVIGCQNGYYALGNAVWFVSSSPTGSWSVATSVPDEVYTIPPSSPLYYVTYVYIGYSDADQVETGYLPGYTGSYVDDGSDVGPVYGTGWYYAPWVGAYYFGWAWPYGYDYQYRWWEKSWLWRPRWNRVGNFYAVNRGSVYNEWLRADGERAYVARANMDRAAGAGYPTMYGRFAGATRAVPMSIPARAALANPYAAAPGVPIRGAAGKGAEQLWGSAKVGSQAARDLYATSDGSIYRRQEGKWYRAGADGKWAYVTPAVGPKTTAYHPETVAGYDRPAAYRPVETPVVAPRVDDAAALDRDYYARAMAERSVQQGHPAYRGRR